MDNTSKKMNDSDRLSSLLKALIGAVPSIGGLLNELISQTVGFPHENSVESWRKNIATTIDDEYLDKLISREKIEDVYTRDYDKNQLSNELAKCREAVLFLAYVNNGVLLKMPTRIQSSLIYVLGVTLTAFRESAVQKRSIDIRVIEALYDLFVNNDGRLVCPDFFYNLEPESWIAFCSFAKGAYESNDWNEEELSVAGATFGVFLSILCVIYYDSREWDGVIKRISSEST